MVNSAPTFGQMVRAMRMGFGWLGRHGCFMRLSGSGPFKCELRPCELIPNGARSSEPYVVFWDKDKLLDVERIAGIRNLKRVKAPFAFYFDDNGETIPQK